MNQQSLSNIIAEQTKRALWEVQNVIASVPDTLWNKLYCEMPLWKHVYHMLHSLDLWFINPRDEFFTEPAIHEDGLNNLDALSDKILLRGEIEKYYENISNKITSYVSNLQDAELLSKPNKCEYTKFTLIQAQFRHLHCHMGMIMGFIIADTGLWPRVVGLESPIPTGEYATYF